MLLMLLAAEPDFKKQSVNYADLSEFQIPGKILEKKVTRQGSRYLVKWKDPPDQRVPGKMKLNWYCHFLLSLKSLKTNLLRESSRSGSSKGFTMMKKLLIFNPMSTYGSRALWRMMNFGSVSLRYKGSRDHCSYKPIARRSAIGGPEWSQTKTRGAPSEHLDKKKVFLWFVDLRLSVFGEQRPEESRQFFPETYFSNDHWSMCVSFSVPIHCNACGCAAVVISMYWLFSCAYV